MKPILICLLLMFIPVSLADININNSNFYIINGNDTFNFTSNQTYSTLTTGINNITLNGCLLQVVPSYGSVNISILGWVTNGLHTFTIISINKNITTQNDFGCFLPNSDVNININGNYISTIVSNINGIISFDYFGGFPANMVFNFVQSNSIIKTTNIQSSGSILIQIAQILFGAILLIVVVLLLVAHFLHVKLDLTYVMVIIAVLIIVALVVMLGVH